MNSLRKHRRICVLFTLVTLLFLFGDGESQHRARREVGIPDIPGYVTLKCDFHMHTVFSDGRVWPDVRAGECWREGLDAFSITDHVEYQPHREDVPTNHNRSFELARPSAAVLSLIIVRGAEITRRMPPGHLNAIFLKDIDPLETEDFRDAVKAAVDQGAFVFWNHPGWTGQQSDGISRWYDEHTDIYEKGWMHGIEVVNGGSYYPLVHRWCIEKKLALIGSSDVHAPINLDYDFDGGEHRPITLVFAKDRTEAALKEALFARRTAVYWKDVLIGGEEFLNPIFKASIRMKYPGITIDGKGSANIQIQNTSEVVYRLKAAGEVEHLRIPESITLYPYRTVLVRVRGTEDDFSGKMQMRLPYIIENLWIAPEQGCPVKLSVEVNFVPKSDD